MCARSFKKKIMRTNTLQQLSLTKTIALITAVSMVMLLSGLPAWLNIARGASVDDFSVTLSDTEPSVAADQTVAFTTPTGVVDGETITLTYQSDFDISSIVAGDVDVSGSTAGDLSLEPSCTTEDAAVSVAAQVLTIELCGNGASFVASEVVTIEIGENATFGGNGSNQITNATSTGSYTIDLGGTMADSGQTRVYLIDDIEMTAAVSTTFTFDIAGVASGSATANGDTDNTSQTNIATQNDGTDPEVDWGTVSAGTRYLARHDLTVSTNAQGGFAVTVWQDGNLRSANGSDIDQFQDGTPPGSPSAWASPSNAIGDENTWGHLGITSADSTLSGGDDFGAALYAAIPAQATPLEVFYHSGPADGSTADVGETQVGYKLETTALQEAADDYANVITYVATPVF